ncbi:unnamed protein product [Microthlaspi erraticum]|uniref:Importin N-terminal domain-containing protein n=1 Tax=Microthlaspi erraticum TaxID=1685480 RepID=A0A6D2KB09_9BRAS|nr:unnamed protein product [Microthlaspi erraticum]
MAEKLRDLSQPIDVSVLDAIVADFFVTESKEEVLITESHSSASVLTFTSFPSEFSPLINLHCSQKHVQSAAADHILRDLQANPDMWLQVVHILQNTKSIDTKLFALQVLEGVIKNTWNALPVEQRDGMKSYILEVIVQLSSNEASFILERLYVNKLNVILVQMAKHDWPEKWTSFFPDLVSAAKTSETSCENFMAILRLLSEEVFDFSRGEMTPQKIEELKQSLSRHVEYLLKYFGVPASRNIALQCLTKVFALDIGDVYNAQYYNMYAMFTGLLKFNVPQSIELAETYSSISGEDQAFIKNLALFFTSFFKFHMLILKSAPKLVLIGLQHLMCISYVDDSEVFKLIESNDNWRIIYSIFMSELRGLMINRMAKPEEVLIVEDENGDLVRETKKDIDVIVQYNIMKVTLIDLLNLDCADTVEQVQCDRDDTSRINNVKEAKPAFNWGAMSIERFEFFVLGYWVYVVGQYPRFLSAHWKILKTVVEKLFEFMHDTHPVVQDMACDTFLREFVLVQFQDGENEPFVSELLSGRLTTVRDLEPHQIRSFFESVGNMIQAESDPQKRDEYLQRLMALSNHLC